jgi:hypothetical protein
MNFELAHFRLIAGTHKHFIFGRMVPSALPSTVTVLLVATQMVTKLILGKVIYYTFFIHESNADVSDS